MYVTLETKREHEQDFYFQIYMLTINDFLTMRNLKELNEQKHSKNALISDVAGKIRNLKWLLI